MGIEAANSLFLKDSGGSLAVIPSFQKTRGEGGIPEKCLTISSQDRILMSACDSFEDPSQHRLQQRIVVEHKHGSGMFLQRTLQVADQPD